MHVVCFTVCLVHFLLFGLLNVWFSLFCVVSVSVFSFVVVCCCYFGCLVMLAVFVSLHPLCIDMFRPRVLLSCVTVFSCLDSLC